MSRGERTRPVLAVAALLLAGCASPGERKEEDLSLCLQGSRASQSGQYDQALGLFEGCIDKGNLTRHSLGRTYRNIGDTYRMTGEPAKAAAYFGYSLALGPDDPWEDYVSRGTAWSDAGDREKALADYDQALELRPDDDEALFDRGLLYERMGRKAEAHADFKRAHDLGLRSEAVLERLRVYTAAGLDGAKRAPGGPFDKLGSSYQIGPAARAKSIGAIWEDHASCREGRVSNEQSAHPDAESLRKSGRFEFPGGDVAVVFPQLPYVETLDVRIQLNDTARGVRDDYLAFSAGTLQPSTAAVVRTILPKRMQGSAQVHKAILQQVEGQSVGLARDEVLLRELDGPWGALIEVLVRSRAATPCFPTAPYKQSPPDTSPATIGVSRYLARRDLLVEISLIVRIPAEVPIPEQGEYARERMNEFMGAISIP